jgi:phosphopantothenoylcysteine decarboxylase / phosphopantothenate---cysteine ligase
VKVLLGVSGGIAAYKACEITSLLVKGGHEVQVIMTANASRFVGPLSFAGLSGKPVVTDTFADAMAHIHLAKWADAVLVAPMSANLLGRLACGLADDALTTTLMAVPAGVPIVLAPAMNTQMWQHPATVRNLGWLEALKRYRLVAPTSKRLACGDVGPGALADPEDLVAAVTETTA